MALEIFGRISVIFWGINIIYLWQEKMEGPEVICTLIYFTINFEVQMRFFHNSRLE